jgi:hypothetical protein
VELAGVSDDPVRREIDEGSPGMQQAMGQEPQVASTVSADGVDKQVRRAEHRNQEPDADRNHEGGSHDDEDEDRQRRAHQEPDENDGRHPDGPERSRDADGCVLLKSLGR